jgi:hypothetical protein
LLFARLVDRVRAKLFDSASPVANAFRTKVLLGEVLMVGMDLNLRAFEKRMVFFESFNARKDILLNGRVLAERK